MLYFTPLLEERGLSALLKGTLMPAWWYLGLNFVPVTQSLAMVWFLLKHLAKIWCFVLYFQDTLCLCKNPGFICAFEVGVWQLTSHKMPPKNAVFDSVPLQEANHILTAVDPCSGSLGKGSSPASPLLCGLGPVHLSGISLLAGETSCCL